MTEDEKDYFKLLGSRIAQLRKAQGLTQVQLAEALEISQQVVASYEIGRRRIPVSMLPDLARALAVGLDELLGETAKARAKRGRLRCWLVTWSASARCPSPGRS